MIENSDKKVILNTEKSHNTPGWNEFVKPFHETARRKYLFWKELGSPRNGVAYQQMVQSRREFKRALDTCKNMKDVILKNKIGRDMNSKKPWKTINKVRKQKPKISVSVNGVSGEREIAEIWREHYANLMSGEGHPPVNELDNQNYQTLREIPKVTVNDVQNAMKDLSLNSSPGLDNVTGDHLRFAHPAIYVHLSLLFTAMFRHMYIPSCLTDIKICNLVKDQHKSLSELSNYRPIALASIISKLFECIILKRCINNLKTTDNQFAYKSQHSTDMALFLLKQTIEAYRSKNTPVFLCTMDLSKAFDRVCHQKLFNILKRRQVPDYIIAVLRYWYSSQKFQVSWGNAISSPFSTGCGIRQGSVLSALLFSVYMDDLSTKILHKENGCTIGDTRINHIFYADDLILLAPSVKALQNLIDKCSTYFNEHFLSVNIMKTKVVCIRPKRMIYHGEPQLYINNIELEVVKSFKYLGMEINDSLTDDSHIATLYRGQCMRSNILNRNFKICDNNVKVKHFKSFCTSIYGIPLSLACRDESMRKLKVCYNNSLRFLMGIEI